MRLTRRNCMKKIVFSFFTMLVLLLTSFPVFAETDEYGIEIPEAYYDKPLSDTWDNWPAAPPIYAESGILVDLDQGKILYSKNVNDIHYPASITKIMTAYLAAENCRMDEIVTFSQTAIDAIDWTSSNMGTLAGEELTMEQCMYGMMLQSANEVCCGVAEHVSGSIQGFVDLMNQKAAELGCRNTHFMNPNGLPDENHYTTAYDFALIAAAAFQNEVFRTIAGTTYYEIPPTNKYSEVRNLGNHHKMMLPSSEYYYEGILAGKTGYTLAALNTLVTFAQRNGKTLMCVTMRTEGRQVYRDTASLFDYGFNNSFPEENASYLSIAPSEAPSSLPAETDSQLQTTDGSEETLTEENQLLPSEQTPGTPASPKEKSPFSLLIVLIFTLLVLIAIYAGLVIRARIIRKKRRLERMRRREQMRRRAAQQKSSAPHTKPRYPQDKT